MNKNELKESISSKKFIFVIGCVFVIFFFAYTAAKTLNAMIPMYDTFVGGVLGLAGLYLAGNVANKFVVGKVKNQPIEQVSEESPEVSPEAKRK